MKSDLAAIETENRQYKPVQEVTYYQARCTRCGKVQDSYGDFSAWSDEQTAIESVVDSGWLSRSEGRCLKELICEPCQKDMVKDLTPEEEDEFLERYE